MIRAELLLSGFAEVATLGTGGVPRAGAAQRELSLYSDASIAIDRGRIVALGARRRVARTVQLRPNGRTVESSGQVALPGFVDAHSHLLFAGTRHREIEAKLAGADYATIARSGGGIYSTVRRTRAASASAIIAGSLARLRALARSGVVAAEVKSGYALSHAGELDLLRLIPRLEERSGVRLVPTYLGAHAPPPGRSRPGYVRELTERTLPAVAAQRLARFCDVFCEPGFFSPAESERILRRAAQLGLGLKLHADEFADSGGAALAARLGATSADHLLSTRASGRRALARAGVTGVLLPVTPFASLSRLVPPGRELVDAGVPVALGSDCSPNSWVESMPVVLAHAVYRGRLTPAEAITAATVNAAHASGLPPGTGTLSVGGAADLLVFSGHAAEEIPTRFGALPEQIYRRGEAVFSTTVRE
ncbi:MAG TPA: imidazolonepropionase [Thermoplasmata archaeon]|nr:imidazolonepropionase [Thermoplasmata archaeon]